MARIKVCLLAVLMLFSASTFAVDGVTLISQASVNAAGGFPYQINQSGSYKLSSNLTVTTASPDGTDGIDINADNVVIDLNGFTIQGACPASCDGNGISSFSHHTITIKNGIVTGWGQDILLSGNQVGALIEEVHANNNLLGVGIEIDDGIVRRCTATGNFTSIIVHHYGVVESNISSKNVLGFELAGTTATGNTSVGNTQFGLIASADSVVGSNVLSGNGTDLSLNGSKSQNNNVCTGGTTC